MTCVLCADHDWATCYGHEFHTSLVVPKREREERAAAEEHVKEADAPVAKRIKVTTAYQHQYYFFVALGSKSQRLDNSIVVRFYLFEINEFFRVRDM